MLTEAGELLLPHAERTIAAAEQAAAAVAPVKDLLGGTASLGTFAVAYHYIVRELVAEFASRHADVMLRVVGQNSVEVVAAVRAGDLDAGLITLPIDAPGLEVRPVMTDENFYVASEGLVEGQPIAIHELARERLILYDAHFGWNDPTRHQLALRAHDAGVELQPRIEVESVDSAIALAAQGLGGTFVSGDHRPVGGVSAQPDRGAVRSPVVRHLRVRVEEGSPAVAGHVRAPADGGGPDRAIRSPPARRRHPHLRLRLRGAAESNPSAPTAPGARRPPLRPEGTIRMDVLKGIYSAMVTPFSGDGSAVDEAALRALVDRMAASGIQGLVPCGSTGEVTSLTPDERRRVTEIVHEQAAGRLQVVPHVGALVTRDAVALARHAEACGASAVLAITPFYEPIGEDEVIAYYAAIADAISIPICVYNIPVATGVDLGVDGLVRIARAVPSVSFVKTPTGNFSQVQRLAMDHADEIKVLTGADNHVLPALQHGAHGVIVGAPNLVADEFGTHVGSARARTTTPLPGTSGAPSSRSCSCSSPAATTQR